MSNNDQGDLHSASAGGVAGSHPDQDQQQFLIAPATSSELNVLRLALVPVACWRVDDIRFDFDSSFVVTSIQSELKQLSDLIRRHPACPLAVFGHADPVGSDEYNKALSGRRATAVYAVLIAGSDLEFAAGLWETIAGQENWGTPALNAMQQATGLPSGSSRSTSIRAYLQLIGQNVTLAKGDFLGKGADSGGKVDLSGVRRVQSLVDFLQQRGI